MKTSDIATLIGVHPQTIRRWTNRGQLKCSRTLGNHRRFSPPSNENKQVIGYARVSSADQKEDLVRQANTLRSHPGVDVVFTDTGSGMNYHKPGFKKLLLLIFQGKVSELVLTHRDRLLRFGADLIFSICKYFGVKVTVLHAEAQKSSRESFCDDLVEIITVFCSRIYGQRSHANRLRQKSKSPCSTLINNNATA